MSQGIKDVKKLKGGILDINRERSSLGKGKFPKCARIYD
jgi:hypothetical protein